MDDLLFFKIWRNVYLYKIIIQHSRLFKINEIKEFYCYDDLKEFSEKGYVEVMVYEGEDELGIGDLNEFTNLKTLKLNEDSISSIPISIINSDSIPKTVKDIQINFQISNTTIEYNCKIPDYTTSIFNIYVSNQVDNFINLLSRLKLLTTLEISVTSLFNYKLSPGFFSNSITNLNLGCDWNNNNTPLSIGDLPNSLISLKIIGYNQELGNNVLPSTLTNLKINHPSSESIWILPSSLKQLSITQSFRNSDNRSSQPRQFTINENLLSNNINLTKLKIGTDNIKINSNSIPNSIKYLNISGTLINSSISKNMLSNSLKVLKFIPSSNKFKFDDDALPVTLEHLECKIKRKFTFGNELNKLLYTAWNTPITVSSSLSFFPQSITYLDFGIHWNQPLLPNVLPSSLKSLIFPNNSNFNQPLQINSIPPNLKTLYLGSSYSQLIKPGILPNSLSTLCIPITNNNVLQVGSIPNSVNYLIVLRPSSINSSPDCFDLSITNTTPISSYVLTTPNIIPPSVIKMSLPTSIFKNCEIPLFVEKIIYR